MPAVLSFTSRLLGLERGSIRRPRSRRELADLDLEHFQIRTENDSESDYVLSRPTTSQTPEKPADTATIQRQERLKPTQQV